MKARRFLNVAVERYGGGLLSRIANPRKHLFYPSRAEAQQHQIQRAAAAAKAKEEESTPPMALEENYDGVLRLPEPKLRFKPSNLPGAHGNKVDLFPFYGGAGGDEGRFLYVDESGMAALYNADASTVEMVPGLVEHKGWCEPVSFSVAHTNADDPTHADALYIMDGESRSFDALVYGDPDPSPYRRAHWLQGWHWRHLPPPPANDDDPIQSYALVHGQDGGGTVYISISRPRTYWFDIGAGTGEWTKAGDWALPFFSRSLHVPELGGDLLFGIENEHPYRFCAVDVSGIKMNIAPVLRHAWQDVHPVPGWHPTHHSLVYLGDGRFCIHRSFNIIGQGAYSSDWDFVGTVVLLTGVEVLRVGSAGLQMIKHKSKRLDSCIGSVM